VRGILAQVRNFRSS